MPSTNGETIRRISISKIKVGRRHRKDLGDIAGLAEDILEAEENGIPGGLLQPIGITPNHRLIWGERRLRAFKKLKRKIIPARVVDLDDLLLGETIENAARKELTVSERVSLGKEIERRFGERRGGDRWQSKRQNFDVCSNGRSDDHIARLVGFGNRQTYRDAKLVLVNGAEELIVKLDAGDIAVSAAATLARKASPNQQKQVLKRHKGEEKLSNRHVTSLVNWVNRRKKEGTKQRTTSKKHKGIELHHCRFQNLEIEPGSVSLILTDLPFDRHFIRSGQLEELGEFAESVLMPRGFFVAWMGVYFLEQVMEELGQWLTWGWQISYIKTGRGDFIAERNCYGRHWPILVFTKGKWKRPAQFIDVIEETPEKKKLHPFQKPLADVEQLISLFSKKGDLVVDPFAGSFTTALACQNIGRRFVGCDNVKRNVDKGRQRLAKR